MTAEKRIYNAFVSSTFTGLEDERKAVLEVLDKLGIPSSSAMDRGGASPMPPEELSLQGIDNAQLYIAVIAGRYGSGIWEKEYRRAVELGLPRFIYLKAESAITEREDDPEKAKLLARFREELLTSQEQTYDAKPFRDPYELAAKVAVDLHKWFLTFADARKAVMTLTDLHTVGGFGAYGKRPPLVSGPIRNIVDRAVKAVESQRKVLILGEAGIGKTAALYLVCRSLLLKGRRLYQLDAGTEGLTTSDILFRDDMSSALHRRLLASSPLAAMVTCRPENSNWRRGSDWIELTLSRDDFPHGFLKALFEDCLNGERVPYTEEGVEEAIRICKGLPLYLAELARSCRGRELTVEVARQAPSGILDLIQAEILSVKDFNSLRLLFAVACSDRLRLHRIQLQAIITAEPAPDTALPREFESLTVAEQGSVFSLGHGLWRDVLLCPWNSMGETGKHEPDGLKRLREDSTIQDELRASFRSSIPLLLKLRGFAAAAAARVALENAPSILSEIERAILDSGFEKAYLVNVLELLAVRDPTGIKDRFRTDFLKADDIFPFIWLAETLGFRSDNYVEVRVDGSSDNRGVIPALPRVPEFIAPAYQALLLEESADFLLKHPRSGNDPIMRARLFSDLGAVKAILGCNNESLEALRRAVDEWRLVCCSGENVFKGAPIKFHYALDKLGAGLLAAGKNEEALVCLQRAVRATRLIHECWLIMTRANNETDAEGKIEFTLSPALSQELASLVSVFQKMPNAASSIETKTAIESIVDSLDNGAFVGPMDELMALADSLGHLATALRRTGHTAEAQRALDAALKCKQYVSGYYKNQGLSSALGDQLLDVSGLLAPEPARRVLHEALEIFEKLSFRDDAYLPKMAEALENLGALSGTDSNESLRLWKRAEEIYVNLASVHPRFVVNYLRVTLSLARILLTEKNEALESIEYCWRAKQNLETLSPSSNDFLTFNALLASILGWAYLQMEEWESAIEHFRDAELHWAGLKSVDNWTLLERAETMLRLGDAFWKGKHQPESALEPYAKAIAILKQIHDPDDRESGTLASALDRLGSAQADCHDLARALASYQDAQEVLRKLPRDQPYNAVSLATNLHNVARLRLEKGDVQQATSDLNEAEAICHPLIDSSQAPNEEVTFLFAALAKAYKKLGDNKRSADCFRVALKQLQRLTEADHRLAKGLFLILNDYADLLQCEPPKVEELVSLYEEIIGFLKRLGDAWLELNLASALLQLCYWLLRVENGGAKYKSRAAYDEANAIFTRHLRIDSKSIPAEIHDLNRQLRLELALDGSAKSGNHL